jgi:pimeloyl-ACP methyl ester carboxylesterase
VASFLSILGLLGMPVGAYLISLCARGATTPWAWAWMAVYVLLDLGCFWLVGSPRRARVLLGLGLALLVAVVGLRHLKSYPTGLGSVVRLPANAPGRWIGRLGEEADLGPMMVTAFGDFGAFRGEDVARARPFLKQDYRRMRADTDFAPVPSTLAANMLGMTSPTGIETLVFNPPPEGRADRAIIFLHGAGPLYKLPCWMLARRMPDAMIICPTVGLRGEWLHPDSAATFQTVLSWARERSSAVYAIGWGTGGHGLLRMLNGNSLGHVSGMVLVSGYDENYFDDVRRSGLPILILHGEQDNRTPAFRVDGLAGLDRVRNLEMPGDYFVFYEQEEVVLEEIDSFCGAH